MSHRNHRARKRDQSLYQCKICRQFHPIRCCKRFLNMDVRTRTKIVEKYHYCTNCLAQSHDLRACPCPETCRICNKYHHTLLHPSVKSRLNMKRPQHRQRKYTSTSRHLNSSTKRAKPSSSPKLSQRREHSPVSEAATSPSTSAQKITLKPNSLILSEAIRSLAEVLCVHSA